MINAVCFGCKQLSQTNLIGIAPHGFKWSCLLLFLEMRQCWSKKGSVVQFLLFCIFQGRTLAKILYEIKFYSATKMRFTWMTWSDSDRFSEKEIFFLLKVIPKPIIKTDLWEQFHFFNVFTVMFSDFFLTSHCCRISTYFNRKLLFPFFKSCKK